MKTRKNYKQEIKFIIKTHQDLAFIGITKTACLINVVERIQNNKHNVLKLWGIKRSTGQ